MKLSHSRIPQQSKELANPEDSFLEEVLGEKKGKEVIQTEVKKAESISLEEGIKVAEEQKQKDKEVKDEDKVKGDASVEDLEDWLDSVI